MPGLQRGATGDRAEPDQIARLHRLAGAGVCDYVGDRVPHAAGGAGRGDLVVYSDLNV